MAFHHDRQYCGKCHLTYQFAPVSSDGGLFEECRADRRCVAGYEDACCIDDRCWMGGVVCASLFASVWLNAAAEYERYVLL